VILYKISVCGFDKSSPTLLLLTQRLLAEEMTVLTGFTSAVTAFNSKKTVIRPNDLLGLQVQSARVFY
jgi:hypothetical protein